MIRFHDYRCPTHGKFEVMQDGTAPAQSQPCPECMVLSPWVISAPRISGGVFVVDFPGGHTLTRDECERRLETRPGVPSFDMEAIERKADKVIQQWESGTLPPRPELKPEEKQHIEKVLAKAK